MNRFLIVALVVGLVLLATAVIGSKAEASSPEWMAFNNVCAFITKPSDDVVIRNNVDTMQVRFHNGKADKVVFGTEVIQPVVDVNILEMPCRYY